MQENIRQIDKMIERSMQMEMFYINRALEYIKFIAS
jgi:hypothetical protein